MADLDGLQFHALLAQSVTESEKEIASIEKEIESLRQRRAAAVEARAAAICLQDWHLQNGNGQARPEVALFSEQDLVGMSIEQALHAIASSDQHGVLDTSAALPVLLRTKHLSETHPHPLKTLSGILGASPRFGKIRTGVYHLIRQGEGADQGNGQHASS